MESRNPLNRSGNMARSVWQHWGQRLTARPTVRRMVLPPDRFGPPHLERLEDRLPPGDALGGSLVWSWCDRSLAVLSGSPVAPDAGGAGDVRVYTQAAVSIGSAGPVGDAPAAAPASALLARDGSDPRGTPGGPAP